MSGVRIPPPRPFSSRKINLLSPADGKTVKTHFIRMSGLLVFGVIHKQKITQKSEVKNWLFIKEETVGISISFSVEPWVNRKAGNTKTEAKRIEEELRTKLRLKMLHVSDLTDTGDRLLRLQIISFAVAY